MKMSIVLLPICWQKAEGDLPLKERKTELRLLPWLAKEAMKSQNSGM